MALTTRSSPEVLLGDACKLPLRDSSVDLIVTHPPFFLVSTSRYGGDTSKQINFNWNSRRFLKRMTKAVQEMERVLKESGSIWISVGSSEGMDFKVISKALEKTALKVGGMMVHDYFTPADSAEALRSDRVSTWVQLVKLPTHYTNPFMCKRYSGPVWSFPFNNVADPVDKELSKSFFMEDVVNKEIPKRLIEMYSKRGHTVLDPFGGSGIVAVTAAELGRKGISVDISENQVQAAHERIRLTLPQDLPGVQVRT
jgi:tRNA G10  N-methylase Trm11